MTCKGHKFIKLSRPIKSKWLNYYSTNYPNITIKRPYNYYTNYNCDERFWKRSWSCTDGSLTWKKHLHSYIISMLEVLNSFIKTRFIVKLRVPKVLFIFAIYFQNKISTKPEWYLRKRTVFRYKHSNGTRASSCATMILQVCPK